MRLAYVQFSSQQPTATKVTGAKVVDVDTANETTTITTTRTMAIVSTTTYHLPTFDPKQYQQHTTRWEMIACKEYRQSLQQLEYELFLWILYNVPIWYINAPFSPNCHKDGHQDRCIQYTIEGCHVVSYKPSKRVIQKKQLLTNPGDHLMWRPWVVYNVVENKLVKMLKLTPTSSGPLLYNLLLFHSCCITESTVFVPCFLSAMRPCAIPMYDSKQVDNMDPN